MCLKLVILTLLFVVVASEERPVWTWKCAKNICEKRKLGENAISQSLSACKLLCDPYANLWPRPTGDLKISNVLIPVNPHGISFEYVGNTSLEDKQRELIQNSGRLFQTQQEKKVGDQVFRVNSSFVQSLSIQLDITNPKIVSFASDTDESYQLLVKSEEDSQIKATISANTFFGARHGLETLSQIMIFDDVSGNLVIPDNVYLNDRPAYPYRGILLDTARNYFSVDSIKRTLDAMAANKLNTFHWHMTDSQSFPFQSKKYPQFSRYGAYSPRKVYTYEDIQSIVEYGRVRGIRILPELDQPAHVGEGWQWAPNTTLCFKAEPWYEFCKAPPCGQLNPTNDYVYEILRNLYTEFLELFDSDLFHMGGDEVNFNCWKHLKVTRKYSRNYSGSNIMKLWKYFQERSYQCLVEANGGKELPVVLWSSELTARDQVDLTLEKEKYIIQIWSNGVDKNDLNLVKKGYRVIFSNYNALYFDCGFGSWVGSGNNWCSPYIGWQKVYDNDPLSLLKQKGINIKDLKIKKLVLGAEATLFSEQVDETSLDSRLWPRASAMAERLWSRPKEYWRAAESRILEQRERLVRRGIEADQIEPEWCFQNQGYCHS